MSISKIVENWEIPQNWQSYSTPEHDIWSRLYMRQMEILPNRACKEFLDGLSALDLNNGGIPNFFHLNERLISLTGWRVIAVNGLIPDAEFFELLANRIFPAGQFIRKPSQFDYISEPDIFHDIFGHVPLLTNDIFANYMQAYGEGGCRAFGLDCLKELARLYWYTVEFGLIDNEDGLRIYGAGILSSPQESIYALSSKSPARNKFDLESIMGTDYKIDDLQERYFIIENFEQLFDATLQDFAPIYQRIKAK